MLRALRAALRRIGADDAGVSQSNASDDPISPPTSPLDIAIVGISGRYPQARDLNQFWTNLATGRDCITEIPTDRWDHARYFDADKSKAGSTFSKWGGFIDDVDRFDPLFFNISPRDAEFMEPQERLFLQCVYEVLEDAGYRRSDLAAGAAAAIGRTSNVGVYVGVMYQEYQLYGVREQEHGNNIALYGNSANVANRVSYFFDFSGPSIAIDTMCSSSLTAIHLACEDLRKGVCTAAIAGGVNVTIHPNKYLALAQGRFVSSKGQCQSFGKGGDGYVPGEGVGAVLLKPLAQAVTAGDHIYGVIKASAINHGGKANGYSGPNPVAQAKVISQALRQAGLHPRAISYIEAHGTGTALGDPIEIAGLNKAFRAHTSEKQFCAIGSVKSNIGHCESAAGIAGLTKVLLQMKHHQLVPSLHSKELNPHIDFANSAFIVQQELAEWRRPVLNLDDAAQEGSRIAGISSFGAGGSNAHIIVEEYIARCVEPERIVGVQKTAASRFMIVLSAKDEDRLRERAAQLVGAIRTELACESDLADLAYTLQSGRDEMEARLGCSVQSTSELAETLSAFVEGVAGGRVYQGHIKHQRNELVALLDDDDLSVTLRRWADHDKHGKILELWVKGLPVDWSSLCIYEKPRRLSLPTYPFARERYWVKFSLDASGGKKDLPDAKVTNSHLHPLLHANTSDLSEQRFSSTFSGEEWFLADHVVNGARLLPAAVQLEMGRVAVHASLSLPLRSPDIFLERVEWVQPIAVVAAQQVHVRVRRSSVVEVIFELYSVAADTRAVVHARGCHAIGEAGSSELRASGFVDVSALRADAHRSIDAADFYAAFRAIGIEYGRAYQAVKQIHLGRDPDGRPVVLAEVSLPSHLGDSSANFHLHPSVLDGAMQAALGLGLVEAREQSALPAMFLPVALGSLESRAPSPQLGWVYLRSNASDTRSSIRSLDVDICDNEGAVCIRLNGLRLREVSRAAAEPVHHGRNTVLYVPTWDAVPISEAAADRERPIERWVVLDASYQYLLRELESQHPSITWRLLPEQTDRLSVPRIGAAVELVLNCVRTILSSNPKVPVLLQVVAVAGRQEATVAAALSGLFKSASRESTRFAGQVIEVLPALTAAQLMDLLARDAHAAEAGAREVRHSAHRREVACFKELVAFDASTDAAVTGSLRAPWKAGGVYVITGGAGALGLIFAREITRYAERSRVILTGRSSLTREQQQQIDQINGPTQRVQYRVLDVVDPAAVEQFIAAIVADCGGLHGIVHSAGVIRDSFIRNKTVEELTAVLAPKVAGTLNLDRATRHLQLDCFILFSSIAGSLGNVGQGDYGAANAFMDRYASYRNDRVRDGLRHGRTLSINWPAWEEGGMKVDEQTRAWWRRYGLTTLSTIEGVEAFYRAWSSSESQVMVLVGDRVKLQAVANMTEEIDVAATGHRTSGAREAALQEVSGELRAKTLAYLRALFGATLKLAPEKIDVDEGFATYGIESVLALKLVDELEQTFGKLSRTLIFEYQSIAALAEYFITNHRDALGTVFDSSVELGLPIRPSAPTLTVSEHTNGRDRFTDLFADSSPAPLRPRRGGGERAPLDIAIIGLSGRYPGARDLTEYWRNLLNGKGSIREVPLERWDYRQYFDVEKGKPGSTYSKWGGFLDGVDEFDSLFFNISPREARFMDPQERLFIQCVYATLEDAGYTRDALARTSSAHGIEGNVGVFVGVMYEEYQLYGAEGQARGQPYTLAGSPASIANRISHFCNFRGPSLAVDTMCSGSLTAIYLACQSLVTEECEAAIAGGVNISVHPNKYLTLSQAQFLSSSGRCQSFGQGADGYVPGEGVGAILLRPLHKALDQRDRIYGVIRGCTINHGGRASGYTVPNPRAQAQVVARALKNANVNSRTITYVEAHGTGTALGDPIEISALTQAFASPAHRQYCAIGSVKSNIGHLESAAGIAGLTKILLQMQHKTLVPSLHAESLNPYIEFERTPFRVQRQVEAWTRPVLDVDGVQREYPRIAGLSSFGAGGSNAHLIVEEYLCPSEDRPLIAMPALIVLSAKGVDRLDEYARSLLRYIQARDWSHNDLIDLAYTLQVGRESMSHRLAFTAATIGEVASKLQAFLSRGRDLLGAQDCYYGDVEQEKDTLSFLTSDEELEASIRKWVQKGKYDTLLRLWVKGVAFDWRTLYSGSEVPRRIGLPTYPFARDRHWGVQTFKSGSIDEHASRIAASESVFLLPIWEQVALGSENAVSSIADKVILVGATREELSAWRNHYTNVHAVELADMTVEQIVSELSQLGEFEELVWLQPENPVTTVADELLISRQREGVIALYRWTKALLHLGYADRKFALSVVTQQAQAIEHGEDVDPTHAAVHGFVGSLVREYPHWQIRLIDLPRAEIGTHVSTVASLVEALPRLPADSPWAYRREEWYRPRLLRCTPPAVTGAPYRQDGVYVIVGGAGGIGEVFSEHLIRTCRAKIIWIGRRPLTPEIEAKIERLAALGSRPSYICADAADRESLERAYRQIKSMHARIDGLVHAAIVLADSSVLRMEEGTLTAGLRAKVDVSVRMAQVFASESLDWVLLFSSVQSFVRPAGQGNYVAGCVFEDAFAHQLNREWRCPVKTINWGYWGNVGVVASSEYRTRMAQQGIGSIEPTDGLAALDVLLGGGFSQLGFMKVTQPEVLSRFGVTEELIANSFFYGSLIDTLPCSQERDIGATPEMRRDRDLLEALHPLVVRLLFVQLRAAGLFAEGVGSPLIWREQQGIPSHFDRWLEESIALFTRDGYLQAERSTPHAARISVSETWQRWDERRCDWQNIAGLSAQLTLVQTALRALPAILGGRVSAVDTLFPNSSMELVEDVYKNNAVADHFNAILADAAGTLVEARLRDDAQVPLRILEIGAGTGGASAAIFKRLHGLRHRIAEYCYTDVSGAFLQHAERTYRSTVPYLLCRELNVEQHFEPQAIDLGAYDVVIASNVLHATRNVRGALQNVKAALKRNGFLILNEISGPNLLTHVTFGLLEGWWRYEDGALRLPGSPALSSNAWERVLTAAGFHRTAFPVSPVNDYGLQIIVAESDGLVRRTFSSDVPHRRAQKSVFDSAVSDRFSRNADSARVEETIRTILAAMLSMEPDSIGRDVAFSSFGLDSILSARALKNLNERFGVDLKFSDLVATNSLRKLSELVSEAIEPARAPATSLAASRPAADAPTFAIQGTSDEPGYDVRTIRCLMPARSASTRLLIFPCLGFGPRSYFWVQRLPRHIDVWFVGTSDERSWTTLIATYAAQVRKLFDRPVVAWGHSMGCIAAFELLAHLQVNDRLQARAAILSSCASPSVFERVKRAEPFSSITLRTPGAEVEERLASSHIIMPRSSWAPMISPEALRNDVALIHDYRYEPGKRISSPLLLIHGAEDGVIKDPAVVQQWSEVAAGECLFKEIDANHLLFMDPPKAFVDLIIDCCSEAGESLSQHVATAVDTDAEPVQA